MLAFHAGREEKVLGLWYGPLLRCVLRKRANWKTSSNAKVAAAASTPSEESFHHQPHNPAAANISVKIKADLGGSGGGWFGRRTFMRRRKSTMSQRKRKRQGTLQGAEQRLSDFRESAPPADLRAGILREK
jgi:hypothetical protein